MPPKVFLRFFRWFCHPKLLDHIEGDLIEQYRQHLGEKGKQKADIKFIIDVLLLLRPGIIKPADGYKNLNTFGMYKSYFRIGWRNLLRNRGYSIINISGLAAGMTVAMLIGLWVYDEVSFNENHKNYDRIAQVLQNGTYDNHVGTQQANPAPLGDELRTSYGPDFRYVLMSTGTSPMILSSGDKHFTKNGNYFEPDVTNMLSLTMLKGTREGLKEPGSILISESTAKIYFGGGDPMDRLMKINNDQDVKVTGVYEDLPRNSEFYDLAFIAPWNKNDDYLRGHLDDWNYNSFKIYVQLADKANFDQVSARIRDIKLNKVSKEDQKYKPEIILHPMSKWHLYSEFENGINSGGRIQFVWLFGLIAAFVLFLACINFMNLATAQAERRSKEVGIRKAVGSLRHQVMIQFFVESLLVVVIAFFVSLILISTTIPFFNETTDKELGFYWTHPAFWLIDISFTLLTGFLAGSYPAFYLSSFQPVKVLKGKIFSGRFSSLPRKILVVIQFTVSITLIIGVIVVSQQIQFAKARPLGYARKGLLMVQTTTPDIHQHFDAVADELKRSGAIVEMSESHSPMTDLFLAFSNFDWRGKNPDVNVSFGTIPVSPNFGKTVGWKLLDGRDFSEEFFNDSSSIILNEAAVKITGFDQPVGEVIKFNFLQGKPFTIIGVVKDLVMESPYDPVRPTIFILNPARGNFAIVSINSSGLPFSEAITKIETVFKKYAPASPFNYKFVDEEYSKKFGDEQRLGDLAGSFALLAIGISCLGLFGLALFIAERRTKEIGIRKVIGASVFNLWRMLSGEFVQLVIISCIIAVPIAYYTLRQWLQKYEYHAEISWSIFAATSVGAIMIALITVSYQSIKAALADPVKSLRTE